MTLRCLCEDLDSDWTDSSQRHLYSDLRAGISQGHSDGQLGDLVRQLPTPSRASHPLITSFASAFASDDPDLKRESISGLTDPHWWKQKASRWRGAATDADSVGSEGEVWLCSAGIRADGDDRDFYSQFTRSVRADGPWGFLPTEEDFRYRAVEATVSRFEAWRQQLQLSALICLASCRDSGLVESLHVPMPGPDGTDSPIAHLDFELFSVRADEEEAVEIILVLTPLNYSKRNLIDTAMETIRAVIQETADNWSLTAGKDGGEIWSVLADELILGLAQQAKSEGRIPLDGGGFALKLGVQAHYTSKDQIVDASVDGDPVRALCGQWFVPTRDPDIVPECGVCRTHYYGIPA